MRDYPQHIRFNQQLVPMHDRGFETGIVPVLFHIACLLIVIVIIVALYKLAVQHQHGYEHREPLDIAKERFAKGEISKEELADIKKELKS